MYILFNDDNRIFGFERRYRNKIEHRHIIIFRINICLSFNWWSRDSKERNPIELFNHLDKRIN